MSDLRGAIRDLRNVAKRLDAATFNPEMNALKDFVDRLDKKGTEYKPSEDVREEALAKFLRGDYDFTRRELRSLPFIIHEREITLDDAKNIFDLLDLANKRHLIGLVNVYLNQYDNSAKTELLRQRLRFIAANFAIDNKRLQKIFAAHDKLFDSERFTNMAKLFVQKLSVNDSLETIGLSDFYKASNFIGEALKLFFRPNVASLSAQMKLLTELDTEYDTYKNIFPAIADLLIQAVDRAGVGKRKCMDIFYRRLGDPRFGDSRFKWNNVSKDSKDIFCHWLSEEDLEVFFKIIKQTTVDRMWRYREKFWRAYLSHITKTKIFLGTTARNVAAKLENVKLHHGTLENAEDNQSVFIFQIEQYIFSEWSHNGKLRVHKKDNAGKRLNLFDLEGNFFEYDYIARDDLKANALWEQVHYSPKTYSWQGKVSEWLRDNCKIDKTIDDWRL